MTMLCKGQEKGCGRKIIAELVKVEPHPTCEGHACPSTLAPPLTNN